MDEKKVEEGSRAKEPKRFKISPERVEQFDEIARRKMAFDALNQSSINALLQVQIRIQRDHEELWQEVCAEAGMDINVHWSRTGDEVAEVIEKEDESMIVRMLKGGIMIPVGPGGEPELPGETPLDKENENGH